MKDSISLVAAAVGGFMLSIAAASIIKAAPVNAWSVQSRVGVNPAADLRLQCGQANELARHKYKRRSEKNSISLADN